MKAEDSHGTLSKALRGYLFDHDPALVDLIVGSLTNEWLRCFYTVLLDTESERGRHAWRAYQRLWQQSLEAAIQHIDHRSNELVKIASELRAWAQRLEAMPVEDCE